VAGLSQSIGAIALRKGGRQLRRSAPAETRERVLTAALTLFSANGVDATTTLVSGFRRRISVSAANPSSTPSGSGGSPRSSETTPNASSTA
jgi:hypothetical protein